MTLPPGSTLVVPAVSMGNIPQLAVDLLVHTLDFVKVATLDDLYLHPFLSPLDERPPRGMLSALEVYYSAAHNLAVVQQRSPVARGCTHRFVAEVVAPFVRDARAAKVVLLDSADAGLLGQPHIDVFTREDLVGRLLELLQLASGPLRGESHLRYIGELLAAVEPADVDVYVAHVYEGDNFGDAERLAAAVMPATEWRRPPSWLGVYGDRPVPVALEEGLYG